jgi:hypothetical protein
MFEDAPPPLPKLPATALSPLPLVLLPPRAQAAAAAASTLPWSCPVCTLDNEAAALECAACGGAPPLPPPPPPPTLALQAVPAMAPSTAAADAAAQVSATPPVSVSPAASTEAEGVPALATPPLSPPTSSSQSAPASTAHWPASAVIPLLAVGVAPAGSLGKLPGLPPAAFCSAGVAASLCVLNAGLSGCAPAAAPSATGASLVVCLGAVPAAAAGGDGARPVRLALLDGSSLRWLPQPPGGPLRPSDALGCRTEVLPRGGGAEARFFLRRAGSLSAAPDCELATVRLADSGGRGEAGDSVQHRALALLPVAWLQRPGGGLQALRARFRDGSDANPAAWRVRGDITDDAGGLPPVLVPQASHVPPAGARWLVARVRAAVEAAAVVAAGRSTAGALSVAGDDAADIERATGHFSSPLTAARTAFEGWRVSGGSDFPTTVLAGIALTSGRWYFEVEITSFGARKPEHTPLQFGWADPAFRAASRASSGQGAGDEKHSWAFDGARGGGDDASRQLVARAGWVDGTVVRLAVDCDARRMYCGAVGPAESSSGAGGGMRAGCELGGPLPLGVALFRAAAGALLPALTHAARALTQYTVNFGALGAESLRFPPPPGFQPVGEWFARRAATQRHLPVEVNDSGGTPLASMTARVGEALVVTPLAGARHLFISSPRETLELMDGARPSAALWAAARASGTTSHRGHRGVSEGEEAPAVLSSTLGSVSLLMHPAGDAAPSSSSAAAAASAPLQFTLEACSEWAVGAVSAGFAPDWSAELGLADSGSGGSAVAIISVPTARLFGAGRDVPASAGVTQDASVAGAALGGAAGESSGSDSATASYLGFAFAAGGGPKLASSLRELPSGVFLIVRLASERLTAAVDGIPLPAVPDGGSHWVYPLLPPLKRPASVSLSLKHDDSDGGTLSVTIEVESVGRRDASGTAATASASNRARRAVLLQETGLSGAVTQTPGAVAGCASSTKNAPLLGNAERLQDWRVAATLGTGAVLIWGLGHSKVE